jgi:hypothetical protein
MTSLLRSRQRAQELDARVEARVAGRVDGAARPDDEMDRLVGVVATLRRTAEDDPATPREAFAADLRARLMTEAAHALTPQAASLRLPARPRTSTRRDRRLVAVATATILLGGTAGMAAAAEHALPGEALYPVKRGIERVETRLSGSDAGRGRDLLAQASGRLVEVRGLLDENAADADLRVPSTLAAFTSQAREGSDLLLASYQATGDPADVRAVQSFAATQLRTLEGLDADVPSGAQGALRDAVLALGSIDSRAEGLCGTCSDLAPLDVPATFLVASEAHRALDAAGATRLDNSHRVLVPPDLLRANRQPSGRTSAKPPTTSGAPGALPTGGTLGSLPLPGPTPPSAGLPLGSLPTTAPQLPAVSDLPSLPAPTPPAPSLPAPSLPAPSLPDPSLSAPSLPDPSLPVPSLPVTGDGNLGTGLGDTVDTLVPDAGSQLP